MSSLTKQTSIGIFVVGALILLVAGITVLGSGRLFSDSARFVLFFRGSVSGLDVGAPVSFRGVKVGEVTEIKLMADTADLQFHIPVVVDIEPFEVRPNGPAMDLTQTIDQLIDKGLRAQLTMLSFVTGQCQILLDFHPGSAVHTSGLETQYPEIPTIPSSFQALTTTVEDLPWKDLVHNLSQAVQGMRDILASPDLSQSLSLLKKTLQHSSHITATVDKRLDPTIDSLQSTLKQSQGLIADTQKGVERISASLTQAGDEATVFLRTSNQRMGPLLSSLEQTFTTASSTLEQTRQTLSELATVISRDSGLSREVMRTLEQIQGAARSVQTLSDSLERHPESLLRGKSTGGY